MLDRLVYRLRHIVMLGKSAVLCGPSFAFHLWRMTREARKQGYVMWLVNVRQEDR